MCIPIDANALRAQFTVPENEQTLRATIYNVFVKAIENAPTVVVPRQSVSSNDIVELSNLLDTLYRAEQIESDAYLKLSTAITSLACAKEE